MFIHPHRRQRAFTLVELLVVIAIIGVLIALLLPAIQAAREAARRSQCKNHLKQIGLAVLSHQDHHGSYPSGGWSTDWLGVPEMGLGLQQPGGWPYSLLQFLEETQVFNIGRNTTGANRQKAGLALVGTPVATFLCPSRRAVACYPYTYGGRPPLPTDLYAIPVGTLVAKTDYASSVGSSTRTTLVGSEFSQPTTLAGMLAGYDWTNVDNYVAVCRGVIHCHSDIKPSDVTDGTSKTILIGEKFRDPNRYENGKEQGDDQTLYNGMNSDNTRSVAAAASFLRDTPVADEDDSTYRMAFGGPHPGGCNFVFVDGSVQTIPFTVDRTVLKYLGDRDDGAVADTSGL